MSVQPKPADAPQPTAAAGRLQGALDMLRTDRIGGWAIDRADRGAVLEVDVFREGRRIATLRADRPRKDLAQADGTPGNHGFALALDPSLEPGFEFTIAAVARGRGGERSELRRAGGEESRTPERRILERIFEELIRLRWDAPPKEEPAETLRRVELAQARIEAALAAIEAPAPAPAAGLKAIAIAALGLGAVSLVLGIVSMLGS